MHIYHLLLRSSRFHISAPPSNLLFFLAVHSASLHGYFCPFFFFLFHVYFFFVRLKVCSRNITVDVAQGSKLHLVTPSRSLYHACQILIHYPHPPPPHLVQIPGLYLSAAAAMLCDPQSFWSISRVWGRLISFYKECCFFTWYSCFKEVCVPLPTLVTPHLPKVV